MQTNHSWFIVRVIGSGDGELAASPRRRLEPAARLPTSTTHPARGISRSGTRMHDGSSHYYPLG